MPSRAEQKARTRNALIDSVLGIIGGGANFASISLREVAKTAGVVPTSFYRHFVDMDELGLAVVDELSLDLRRMMRGSFDPAASLDDMTRYFVRGYQRYVLDNADLIQFVNQARTGGTPALRQAIGQELDFLATRIASGLRPAMPGLKPADRDTVSRVIVAVMLENTATLLAISARNKALQDELRDELVHKINVILLGAGQLADSSAPKRRPRSSPRAGQH